MAGLNPLQRFVAPAPGVIHTAARLREDLGAQHVALTQSGPLDRNCFDAPPKKGLAIIDSLLAPRLTPAELLEWRATAGTGDPAQAAGADAWINTAKARQASYELNLTRCERILADHAGADALDTLDWHGVEWSLSLDFSSHLLRAFCLAARVGTDGSPRPGPPLTADDVQARLQELLKQAAAASSKDRWDTRALRKAIKDYEKEDDTVNKQWLVENPPERRVQPGRHAAFAGGYADQLASTTTGTGRPKRAAEAKQPVNKTPADDGPTPQSDPNKNAGAPKKDNAPSRKKQQGGESSGDDPDEQDEEDGPDEQDERGEEDEEDEAAAEAREDVREDDNEDIQPRLDKGKGKATAEEEADSPQKTSPRPTPDPRPLPPLLQPILQHQDASKLREELVQGRKVRRWPLTYCLPVVPKQLLDVDYPPPERLEDPEAAVFHQDQANRRAKLGLLHASVECKALDQLDKDELIELLLRYQERAEDALYRMTKNYCHLSATTSILWDRLDAAQSSLTSSSERATSSSPPASGTPNGLTAGVKRSISGVSVEQDKENEPLQSPAARKEGASKQARVITSPLRFDGSSEDGGSIIGSQSANAPF